ncbi:hypothetical protein BBJ28_00002154 [Nothophytophthora sp. Chile5]|nr:hypothetical protein BBJ28_00002154 [Nothophytophthora sp. Chile5]
MPHSFGYRARTRDMFARPFRQSGMIKMSTYLRTFKVGDYVDIKANGAVQKGMPHKFYHGRTGRVFNVTKRAVGVRVNKIVGNRIIHKHINVRVEHVHQSKCRLSFLTRVKENELKKKEARTTGVRAAIKRVPRQPKAGYTLKAKGTSPITMAAQPFWLDNMEKTDPEGYKQFIATMQTQLQAAGLQPGATGSQQGDADAALFDMLKSSTADGKANSPDSLPGSLPLWMADRFKPRFPGDKVMETDGLKATPEGDKKGAVSLAFDVAVNSKVVEDCQQDKTGAFRNFVCELAIEYIDQKYKIKLDGRYKLPRLTYRGELPPPKHYIRKTQTPIIQEVAPSSKTRSVTAAKPTPVQAIVEKTATASYKIYEESGSANSTSERRICTRHCAIEKLTPPLSPEILQRAGTRLVISIDFELEVLTASDVELELRPELLNIQARGHHDLGTRPLPCLFLPYPVEVDSARIRLDRSYNTLEIALAIDKTWDSLGPDCGSAPWLLAQALNEDDEVVAGTEDRAKAAKPTKSLVEMFHLVNADSNEAATKPAMRWDPVLEDEELPEDRFHRKDMMSMHILEQRKLEREQKAKEAEAKRKHKRAEVEEMQQKARDAGKTWREMYPNEPETTYIDVEDIMRQEKDRLDSQQPQQNTEEASISVECVTTEHAKRAAATWSENNKSGGLDLQSALAFELL